MTGLTVDWGKNKRYGLGIGMGWFMVDP